MRRLSWWFLLAIAVLGVFAAPALAHANLVSSTPAPSSVLEDSPEQIVLDFNEAVSASLSSIELFDQDSQRVELAAPTPGADDSIVTASVPKLDDGLYAVIWRVSSDDGHVVDGTLGFQVGSQATGVDADGLIAGVSADSAGDNLVARLAGLARFASLFGLMLIFGVWGVMMHGVEPPTRTRQLLWLGAGLVALGGLCSFGLLGARARGRGLPGMVSASAWDDVFATRTGALLVLRVALVIALSGVLVRSRNPQRLAALVGGLFAGLVITFGGGGHPSVQSPPLLWVAVDAIHLAAAAMWIGGVLVLALGGTELLNEERFEPVVRAVSRLAPAAVVVVIATGVTQGFKMSGGIGNLGETSWGKSLIAKSLIVVLIIGLGGLSRAALRRRGPSSLRASVFGEALLSVAVIGLAAALTSLPPSAPPPSQVFNVALTQAGTVADISLTPGSVGLNEVHIIVTPPGGNLRPIVGLKARMSLESAGVSNVEVALTSNGPNHYTGTVTLPFAGAWSMDVIIDIAEGQTSLLSTSVPIP